MTQYLASAQLYVHSSWLNLSIPCTHVLNYYNVLRSTMGSFGGHFLPGIFFIGFSIWWMFCQWNRYFKGKYGKGPAFRATCTFVCKRRLCCCYFHWEAFLKIFCCAVGLTGEIITGFVDGKFVNVGNGQHATMFTFFGFAGVLDMVVFYKVRLPKNIDYIIHILCFLVEGLLFLFHLHGRSQFDITVHTLLVYNIYFCIGGIFLEMKFPRHIMASLARSFFVCLQGTWFIQVGSMLYPIFSWMGKWDDTDSHSMGHMHGGAHAAHTEDPAAMTANHNNIMIATIIFMWHMFFIFIFMMVIGLLISRYHARFAKPSDLRQEGFQKLIKTEELSDLESEDEFQVAPENGKLELGGLIK